MTSRTPEPIATGHALRLQDADSGATLCLNPQVLVAGYTGRDTAAVDAHLAELDAHGVPRPDAVPAFYPVSARLLTPSGARIAAGSRSSGEVEPVLIVTPEGWWVGVGSDHTDRELERNDIAASKRAGPKVLSREVVRYKRLRERWDEIVLRAWADGRCYQHAYLAELRKPEELLERAIQSVGLRPAELVLFLGTVPLCDGSFIYANHFCAELDASWAGIRLNVSYHIDSRRQQTP